MATPAEDKYTFRRVVREKATMLKGVLRRARVNFRCFRFLPIRIEGRRTYSCEVAVSNVLI